MLTSLATLNELAIAAKHGTLTKDQMHNFENIHQSHEAHPNNNKNEGQDKGDKGAQGTTTTVPVNYRQPICPWFTCCY